MAGEGAQANMSTQLNLNRSLQLLDKASGGVSSPFKSSRSLLADSLINRTRGLASPLSRSRVESPRLSSTARRSSYTAFFSNVNKSAFDVTTDNTMDLLGEMKYTSALDDTLQGEATTNVTLLLQDNAVNLEGNEMFKLFEEIFQSCRGPHQVFDMMSAYTAALADKTNNTKSLIKNTTIARQKLSGLKLLYSSLRAEMWTWQLAESLLRDIVSSEIQPDDDMEEDQDTQTVTTDQQLMEQFFNQNEKVRRCQIVIDWLETMNSEDVLDAFYNKVQYFTENTNAMWENTLHLKKNASKKADSLVKELDPDAPHRTGEKLSSLDNEDDDRLVRYVFALLRAGKLDDAQQLCVRCGQAWRAATLEGWRLSHDPNYSAGSSEQMDTQGNQFRDVWKSACWSFSQEQAYSAHERAIYACISGNLDQLLPVCDNWSDALWAHLKVLVDVELEQHLRLHSATDHQLVELPAVYWTRATSLAQLFKELEASQKDTVREQSLEFFHKIQKYLIQEDFDALVEVMVDTQRGNTLSPHLLRFMAHFVLFLRSMDKVAVESSMCELVEEYMKHLISSKQYKLVATYCSVLPKENQLIMYAIFLESVTGKDDRMLVMSQGKKAGLDMFTITKVVTENSFIKLKDLLDVNASGDELLSAEHKSEVDKLISNLDWLLFDPVQIVDAIHQCNAQMRVFLSIKQHGRLRQVYEKLPADCVGKVLARKEEMELLEDSNAVKEYLCFRSYLEALQMFDDWFAHLHQAPVKPANNHIKHFAESVALEHKLKQYEQDYQRWENALRATTEHTIDQLKAVLLFAGGWMVDMSEEKVDNNSEARQEQLLRLRQLCIPEIVSLTQKVLAETRRYDELEDLIDLVQSDDYQLYKTYPPNDLQRALSSLQQSAEQRDG